MWYFMLWHALHALGFFVRVKSLCDSAGHLICTGHKWFCCFFSVLSFCTIWQIANSIFAEWLDIWDLNKNQNIHSMFYIKKGLECL